MKKFYEENKLAVIIGLGLIVLLAVIAVKKNREPAAEDRVRMDYVAKRTADSIARGLDSSLTDPIRENVFRNAPPVNQVPVANTPAANTATAGK